ncbi:MAG TPA: VWA domain-containing protein [Vicinamibacterales bacterium]|nr:VWA domain-containing protein [Vicinamibacterales bacterium]
MTRPPLASTYSRAFVVAGVLAAGVLISAQTPPPAQTPPQTSPQQPQTAPTPFKLATDLVRLDVSVLNKDRRPVRDLTAADFTILENGKPQPVAAFSAVDLPEEAPPLAAPWMRDVAADVRDNSDAQQRRLFIIALDDATIENEPKAIQAAKDIARGVVDRMGPSDVASVAFTRDNRHAQDFTSDRARLLKAIDSFTLGFRGQASTGLNAMAGTDDLWYLYSVGLLDRAVEYLTDVSERRKSIIYIGEGIPFDIGGVAGTFNATPNAASGGASNAALQGRIKQQMDDLFDRAQRANVTIYTVDPCGLRSDPPPPVAGAHPPANTCIRGLDLDYLENVAAATGGRAVVNANDFNPGLNAVFLENSSYYLLGFAPGDPARDGKFRTVEVRVNRPGLEVRTRTGYDAPRDVPAGKPKAEASPLMKALAGVVPKSDLPMQITGAAFSYVGEMAPDKMEVPDETIPDGTKAKPKKKKKEEKVAPPPASVLIAVAFKQPIRQSDERAVENVDLQISAFDTDGRSYGNVHQRADVTIRPGASGEAEYEVFGQINLKPGRYQLRIGANLASFADSGSVYYDVDVPDFATDPLSMSGLLLTATPNAPYAPKGALKPTVPIVPTTRRVFTADRAVSVFGRVYQGGKTKPVPVAARLTIRDEKDVIVIDRKQDLPPTLFTATRATDLQIELPIKELPPGAYLVTLETKAGASTVRRDSRFSIAK